MKKKRSEKPFAKKSLGQNFLIDQNYISKIISELVPQPEETIIEIGPGRGALTKLLLESGAKIVAIELDQDLIPILQKEFEDCENFQLIEEDALKVDFTKIPNSQIRKKLVANLPYYISTAILQRLIEQREQFSEFILMLQKEVVDRITAKPGNRERGYLTVLVEAFCEADKLFDVPPTAFRPAPKVWSSVIRLRVKENSSIENENLFKDLISKGFAQKRKTILNNLKLLFPNAFEILQNCRIEPNRRAESLSLEEWQKIISHHK
ncbi:MAG: 16S rRNA (adenine(1518)-N(6)/adenine(1519)-N(6))-dimethyltransferase RsmA [Pyrinomonadaceae bacterium]|nr:16S rRNA (adenine(1518)-N(6)/adenine(1519)-N(6))-dimethyltransferase RsmA [Pyrinomonadaceae bacterium]